MNRRPILPMTASEALACTAIEFGLLLLIATWEGLIFIAIGAVAYLIARATNKQQGPFPEPPYVPWFAELKDIRPRPFEPDDRDQTRP